MNAEAEQFEPWIGRSETAEAVLDANLVRAYLATVHDVAAAPASGDVAPPGIHWCLAPPAAPMSALGRDGHPAKGGFLPPVPLPRRMWAGGRLDLRDPLRVGDAVERVSTVHAISRKEGRSGELWFVTVSHRLSTARGIAVEEQQDLVYRADGGSPAGRAGEEADSPADASLVVPATPTLLFRYSALTFNGHRIHYDRPYAMDVESYDGLVVHGPLQAALMLRLATDLEDGRQPARFSFRGAQPMTDGGDLVVKAVRAGTGAAALWTGRDVDRPYMTARAEW